MSMRSVGLLAAFCLTATLPACAATATWAGMTLADPTDAQRTEIAAAYGEPAGLIVQAVAEGSMAATSDIQAADVLMCVRLPQETDWYPIPNAESMAAWAAKPESTPNDRMRLMLLRRIGADWTTLKCWLGRPLGVPVDEGVLGDAGGQQVTTVAGDINAANFLSTDPAAVLATAPNGVQLAQQDVDIFSGIIAWSFGTRLTEAQKQVVKAALIEFWQQAPPGGTDAFKNSFGPLAQVVPKLPREQAEQVRIQSATLLAQMAMSMPQHPLGQVIAQVYQSSQALAGADTAWPLTRQDVDALIEYTAFQIQVMTGQPVFFSATDRERLTAQIIERYNNGTVEEKMSLADMDAQWAALRVQWALAQAAQQQAAQQQWQQAYQQQYPNAGFGGWTGGAPAAGGGEMSDDQFNTVMNVLNQQHAASMGAIGLIDGVQDTDVYDASGNFLYSY